jgi:hypothetical protein
MQVPEPRTEADAFADSVQLAGALKALGLPVSGARHDGFSLGVGFRTPSGAEGAVLTLPDQPDMAAKVEEQRAAGQGKAGWL